MKRDWFQEARRYKESGDYINSISCFRNVLYEDPEHIEARFYLGELLFQKERYHEAVKEFEQVLKDHNTPADWKELAQQKIEWVEDYDSKAHLRFGYSDLTWWIVNGQFEKVKKYIEDGNDLLVKDKMGNYPLTAAGHAEKEILKLLIDHSPDLYLIDSGGNNVLKAAIGHNKTENLKLLIESGFNVNTPDSNGNTGLLNAVDYSRPAMVRMLLEALADVNASDNNGTSPIIKCCVGFKEECMDIILEYKPDLNKQNKTGYTGLMYVVYCGNKSMTEKLLRAGADIYIKNNNGEDVMDLARKYNQDEILKMLEETDYWNKR